MDGNHRDLSLALVFASVPVQALLMAGVAAVVLGGAPTSQVQYGYSNSVQVNPANGQPAYVFVKPAQACWHNESKVGQPYYATTPGNPMCAYALPDVPDGTQIVNVPCCGNSAP